MSTTSVPAARDLRRQVRQWRRGHADLRLWDVLTDAYIALFAVAMIGSMGASVVVNLRLMTDQACSGRCAEVRTLVPWLSALAVVVLTLGLARLLGPVFSPPAANSWLLSSPVDRGALLRPGLVRTFAQGFALAVLLLLAPVALAGLAPATGALFAATWAFVSVGALAFAARAQVREHGGPRLLTWSLAAVLWCGLAVVAFAPGLLDPQPVVAGPGPVVGSAVACAAAALVVAATRSLPATRGRVLARTSRVVPSLSGALAALDLALLYDVLLARRWGGDATVVSRTGGPRGWLALVHRDARRALRSPQPWLVLAALGLVPHAFAAGGAGRLVVVPTTLAGLLAGPALCAGLRVVTRTDGLARMMPFGDRLLRAAHLVVPGVALLLFGLASAGALRPALPWPEALVTGLACGLSALAATTHWVAARPPDYARPLVSTPAGGLPPGMVLGLLKGFDVWLLTALPLVSAGWGPPVSATLSVLVIGYHLQPHLPAR